MGGNDVPTVGIAASAADEIADETAETAAGTDETDDKADEIAGTTVGNNTERGGSESSCLFLFTSK